MTISLIKSYKNIYICILNLAKQQTKEYAQYKGENT